MGDAQIVRSLLDRLDIPDIEIKHIDRIHDALSYLRHTQVDLILLDVELPDSAAIRFDVVYLRRCTRAPIILVTGMPESALSEFLERHPSLGYLPKSELSTETLREAIESRTADREAPPADEFDIEHDRLLNALSLPVFVIDRMGQVRWSNRAAEGYRDAADAVQRRIAEGGSLPQAVKLGPSGSASPVARIDPVTGARQDGLFIVTIVEPAS